MLTHAYDLEELFQPKNSIGETTYFHLCTPQQKNREPLKQVCLSKSKMADKVTPERVKNLLSSFLSGFSKLNSHTKSERFKLHLQFLFIYPTVT